MVDFNFDLLKNILRVGQGLENSVSIIHHLSEAGVKFDSIYALVIHVLRSLLYSSLCVAHVRFKHLHTFVDAFHGNFWTR